MTIATLISDIKDALKDRRSNFGVIAILTEDAKLAGPDLAILAQATKGLGGRPHVVLVDKGGYHYCRANPEKYPVKGVRLVVAVGDPKDFPELNKLVAQPLGKTLLLENSTAFSSVRECFLTKVNSVSGMWGV